MKFYPYEKGGGKSFGHAEGGGGNTHTFWVVFTQKLEVLAILKGGRKMFLPCLEGDAKRFGPAIFPLCSPSPPRD